jgi:hypothetical protein
MVHNLFVCVVGARWFLGCHAELLVNKHANKVDLGGSPRKTNVGQIVVCLVSKVIRCWHASNHCKEYQHEHML